MTTHGEAGGKRLSCMPGGLSDWLQSMPGRQHRDIREWLQRGGDPNKPDSQGNPPLSILVEHGLCEGIGDLVQAGADLEALNREGLTALCQALRMNNTAMAQALLAAGADPNGQDSSGCAPLAWAAAKSPNSIAVLLQAGALLEARDRMGRTALFLAVAYGRSDSLAVLIEAGANINARDLRGNTALMLAAREQDRLIEPLLIAGADTGVTDSMGRTAQDIAAMAGRSDDFMRAMKTATVKTLSHRMTRNNNDNRVARKRL